MLGVQLCYLVDSTEKDISLFSITDRQGNLFKVNLNIPVVLIAQNMGNLLSNATRMGKERKLRL